jgi:multimeric flavodoxin WrbA
MKICIAYESIYGNGKRYVDYLKKILRAKGNNAQTLSIRDVKPDSLPWADLYIFSTPTHIRSTPLRMRRFLKNLDIDHKGAKYSIMTTCRDENTKCLDKMAELLRPHDMIKVSDGLKIKVVGMKGPLESDYEDRIKSFTMKLLARK